MWTRSAYLNLLRRSTLGNCIRTPIIGFHIEQTLTEIRESGNVQLAPIECRGPTYVAYLTFAYHET